MTGGLLKPLRQEAVQRTNPNPHHLIAAEAYTVCLGACRNARETKGFFGLPSVRETETTRRRARGG